MIEQKEESNLAESRIRSLSLRRLRHCLSIAHSRLSAGSPPG
ncbi:hypothetical protein LINGRAHAP2_LOCUS2787 [Linum grandiflorum]